MKRILLSIPHMSGHERHYVEQAFASNWMSTVGPNIDAFEREFSAKIGRPSVAVSSGTAAIHLGLRLLGVGEGDEVICPTLTFVASANPIRYVGARPVFVDSDRESWNIDPNLLEDVLAEKARIGRLPAAIIVVHLVGQCADMDPIMEVADRYGVPVLEDAAEALGSRYKGKPAGVLSQVAAFSFNGNKIITSTGGGMLVASRQKWADRVRKWATQAREPGIAYEHAEMGYNYRLSNVLAGIGRGQLRVLDLRVGQRREIASRYADAFEDVAGVTRMPQAPYGLHTNWLSCFLIHEEVTGVSRDLLVHALDAAGVEARPLWKPMHMQPLFRDAEYHGGEVAEDLFRRGICLPSSSSLTAAEQLHVINQVRATLGWETLVEIDAPLTAVA